MKSPAIRSTTVAGLRMADGRTRLPASDLPKHSLLPALRAVSFCRLRIIRAVCPLKTQAVTAFCGKDGFQLFSRSSA